MGHNATARTACFGGLCCRSIHKCDHGSLGHCNTNWALHSRSLPTFPPDSQFVCHAYTHIWAKLWHHSLQTSPHSLPPTRLLFIRPPSRHIVMSCPHRRVRINCTAAPHSSLTFPFPFALSSFNLPFVTVFA